MKHLSYFVMGSVIATSCSMGGKIDYPVAMKDTTVVEDYFGTKVHDPYRWLENDTS